MSTTLPMLCKAGMYGQVIFTLHRESPILTVPTTALRFEAEGTQLAIVRAVTKSNSEKFPSDGDYGTEIEILRGLQGDEQVISNPGEKLEDGIEVRVAAPSGQQAVDTTRPTNPLAASDQNSSGGGK